MKKSYKYIAAVLLLIPSFIASAQNKKAEFSVKPTGRFYYEGAGFIEDDTKLSSGTTVNDVRLGLKANYGKWDMKIDLGFAKGKVSAKDIFLQYNFKKSSYFRAGHFAEPFGVDHMESSANIKFITANASSFAFSPGRNLGLEYIGWGNKWWIAGGLFGDTKAMNGQEKGSMGFSGTSRFVFNPFTQDGKILHLGLAGSLRRADANGIEDNSSLPRNIAFSSAILSNVDKTKAISSNVTNANFQAKYAVELLAACGPLFIQSEYFHTNVKRKDDLTSYIAQGVYGQIGVLAIGGDYSYSKSWARFANPKPGSLEFVARYNYTDLNRSKAGIYGGRINDWSFATNYYLNKYVTLKVNYTGMKLGHESPLAGETIHSIQGRLQVVF